MHGRLTLGLVAVVAAAAVFGCAGGRNAALPKGQVIQAEGGWQPPYKGPTAAIVTIYEFSDFQCPFCSRAPAVLDAIQEKYTDKVKLVFRQFPLPFHGQAHLAAEAMLAAQDQGKGWEMHDRMFMSQSTLELADLVVMASDAGLDTGKFKKALEDGVYRKRVDQEIEIGKALGVRGTPSFLINGELLVGAQPLGEFEQAVDQAIVRAKELEKSGVPVEGLEKAFLEKALKGASN